jgi:DNA polymerase-3 subunit epsilon
MSALATLWHRGPLCSWDTETTGTRTSVDRIVTAALIRSDGTTVRWISDADGMEVPAEASAIHGYTTQIIREKGRPAKQVVDEITTLLAEELSAGAALVVMNAPFDLSLLDAECARYGLPTLGGRAGMVGPVVDPLVIDRAADKYRKGRRTLEALAAHYGVELVGAHQADADARAALEVALRLAEKFPDIQVPAGRLHGWQMQWHREWAAGFEAHLRRSGKPDAVVDGSWPLRPVEGGGR